VLFYRAYTFASLPSPLASQPHPAIHHYSRTIWKIEFYRLAYTFDLPHSVGILGYYHGQHSTMASSNTSKLPQNIGWIGLGLMGLPMVTNLLKKMDKSTTFYVFDVLKESVEEFVEAGEGRVKACSSSKEVADKSVCEPMLLYIPF
jgi:hypothetical protein